MHGPVAVIGLGLIGGSLARALAEQGIPVRGWSTSADDRALAGAAGVGVAAAAAAAVAGAATVVFAIPVDRLATTVPPLLGLLERDAVALHAGGVQRQQALHLHDAHYARLLGTHPLAGSHNSGFSASRPDLFAGATVSMEARADASAREHAEWLWRAVGATEMVYRSADEHDHLMTWVSHLPQLAATALAATLAGCGVDPRDVGPGGRDTTRLAASPFEQWRPLLAAAPGDLAAALRVLEARLQELRQVVEHPDTAALAAFWSSARAWRQEMERGQ
ncbi:MAG TPA: prephenate dehydrogenase/arogenate dehydrogenase family protein [Gemmatimonadaceae bacterium]|nr:prephenate dehydrogenase/arogenate dehydrogenase family protein [Gemmatimonadaceae bacterium]